MRAKLNKVGEDKYELDVPLSLYDLYTILGGEMLILNRNINGNYLKIKMTRKGIGKYWR